MTALVGIQLPPGQALAHPGIVDDADAGRRVKGGPKPAIGRGQTLNPNRRHHQFSARARCGITEMPALRGVKGNRQIRGHGVGVQRPGLVVHARGTVDGHDGRRAGRTSQDAGTAGFDPPIPRDLHLVKKIAQRALNRACGARPEQGVDDDIGSSKPGAQHAHARVVG